MLTDCPPGPLERYTSIWRSSGRSSTSTSSASGMTATVAVDVWIRPCDSVTGTRCTRWTPASYFSLPYASLPRTSSETSLKPPRSLGEDAITSVFHR